MKNSKYLTELFRWSKWTPKQVEFAVVQALDLHRKSNVAIRGIPRADRTFATVIEAMEVRKVEVENLFGPAYFLLHVSPSEPVRNAAHSAIEKFKRESVDLRRDQGVYRAVLDALAKKEKLDPVQRKLAADYKLDYELLGMNLPQAKQRKVKAAMKQMNTLGISFSKRIDDYRATVLLGQGEVDGLTEDLLASLMRDSRGRYQLVIPSPEYVQFLQQSTNHPKRREAVSKKLQQGGKENIVTLRRLIQLRREHARLLNFSSHAAFKLKPKMAGTVGAVNSFLRGLVRGVAPATRRDLAQLAKLNGGQLAYEDLPLLYNQLQERRFGFRSDELRQYFPLRHIREEMFKIFSHLFGIRFQHVNGLPTWHPDVEHYRVTDGGKATLGYFAMDLFPRQGKYTHAAVFGISEQPEVAGLVTNFPRPRPGHPSLLSHDEVETLFHEFGHVLHHVLTKASYTSHAGTNVARDFVELPSQLMENWLWHPAMLRRISRHWRTGKPMPAALIKKLVASKKFMIGYLTMRQLTLATFDMDLHGSKVTANPVQRYNKIFKALLGVSMPKGNIFPAGFGHLVGYNAGYYGYLWAKVYAADVFSVFARHGLLSKSTGANYRREILERGSSRPEMESLVAFLGRTPNDRAFLRSLRG